VWWQSPHHPLLPYYQDLPKSFSGRMFFPGSFKLPGKLFPQEAFCLQKVKVFACKKLRFFLAKTLAKC
jgi:hypothetical protein